MKKFGSKVVDGVVVEEDLNEFEVKYPGAVALLLENPFAKKEKASKKKKKK